MKNRQPRDPVGAILVDSIFGPKAQNSQFPPSLVLSVGRFGQGGILLNVGAFQAGTELEAQSKELTGVDLETQDGLGCRQRAGFSERVDLC